MVDKNDDKQWKTIPLNKLKVFVCFCPSEQAMNIWYTNKTLTISLDKFTRDKIMSYDNDVKDKVIVVIRRFDNIIGYAKVTSLSNDKDKDDINIIWNRLICVPDRKAINIFSGKRDGQEITEAKKAEKLLMMLDDAPEVESLEVLKEKMTLGEPYDENEVAGDPYDEMKRPRCDFDITNMTYEEYLVQFANRQQISMAYPRGRGGGRGYMGRNFDPNYRGRGRGRF